MQISVSGKTVWDARVAQAQITKLGFPLPNDWHKVNSLFNPLGPAPARGYFLLRYEELNQLDLNGTHTVIFEDDLGNRRACSPFVLAREPENIMPGLPADPNALYLVELADKRHLLADPFLGTTVNKQYNVTAPAYGGALYETTASGGIEYSWNSMVSDLWSACLVLGPFTGLPFSPNGSPSGWKFVGVNAYHALNQVLWRLNCAIRWDPTQPVFQYTIVSVGSVDGAANAIMDSYAPQRLIFDRQYLDKVLVPFQVKVYFNRQEEHYGTEQTTPKDSSQWSTATPHVETVVGTEVTAANTFLTHTLWDDMPAIYDFEGELTNAAAITARADERGATWFRSITGCPRMHKIFSGIVPLNPGRNVKGVRWGQDLSGIGTGHEGGLITEVIGHPYWMLHVAEHVSSPFECWGGATPNYSPDNQAPDFSPTYPVYPHLKQDIEIAEGDEEAEEFEAVGEGEDAEPYALFKATVQFWDPANRVWSEKEACWAVEMNGETRVKAGRYPARLRGFDDNEQGEDHPDGLPIYSFRGDQGSETGLCATMGFRFGMTACLTRAKYVQRVSEDDESAGTPLMPTTLDDYELPDGEIHRILCNSETTMTGIEAPEDEDGDKTDGRYIEIQNKGGDYLFLKNKDSGSSSANQFEFADQQDIILKPKQTIKLKYNEEDEKWNEISRSAENRVQTIKADEWDSNQDDYPLFSEQMLQVEVQSDIDLTGIGPPTGGTTDDLHNGLMIEIMNVGDSTLTIKHEDSASDPESQFSTTNEEDLKLRPQETLAFKYHKDAGKWYPLFPGTDGSIFCDLISNGSQSLNVSDTLDLEFSANEDRGRGTNGYFNGGSTITVDAKDAGLSLLTWSVELNALTGGAGDNDPGSSVTLTLNKDGTEVLVGSHPVGETDISDVGETKETYNSPAFSGSMLVLAAAGDTFKLKLTNEDDEQDYSVGNRQFGIVLLNKASG